MGVLLTPVSSTHIHTHTHKLPLATVFCPSVYVHTRAFRARKQRLLSGNPFVHKNIYQSSRCTSDIILAGNISLYRLV